MRALQRLLIMFLYLKMFSACIPMRAEEPLTATENRPGTPPGGGTSTTIGPNTQTSSTTTATSTATTSTTTSGSTTTIPTTTTTTSANPPVSATPTIATTGPTPPIVGEPSTVTSMTPGPPATATTITVGPPTMPPIVPTPPTKPTIMTVGPPTMTTSVPGPPSTATVTMPTVPGPPSTMSTSPEPPSTVTAPTSPSQTPPTPPTPATPPTTLSTIAPGCPEMSTPSVSPPPPTTTTTTTTPQCPSFTTGPTMPTPPTGSMMTSVGPPTVVTVTTASTPGMMVTTATLPPGMMITTTTTPGTGMMMTTATLPPGMMVTTTTSATTTPPVGMVSTATTTSMIPSAMTTTSPPPGISPTPTPVTATLSMMSTGMIPLTTMSSTPPPQTITLPTMSTASTVSGMPTAMTQSTASGPTTTRCAVVTGPITCPAGWTAYQATGFCYRVIRGNSNYDTNNALCMMQGSQLASIHSLAENDIIRDLIRLSGATGAWIGLQTLPGQRATYRDWSDGSPLDFSRWIDFNPSGDSPTMPNCAVMWPNAPGNGRWNDVACSSPQPATVCKRAGTTPAPMTVCGPNVSDAPMSMMTTTLAPCPTGPITCPDGWTPNQDTRACYGVLAPMQPTNWNQYDGYCRSINANLVSIHSEGEMLFVRDMVRILVGNVPYYIGAEGDAVQTHSYNLWSDGTAIDYGNFTQNLSGQGPRNCLFDTTAQLWDDSSCTSPQPAAVCKIMNERCRPAPATTSTTATTTTTTTTTTTPCFDVPTGRATCPTGWTMLASTLSCYILLRSGNRNYTQYEELCEAQNATLTSIHSDEENALIFRLRGSGADVWIGLMNVPDYPSTYRRWADGSVIDYTRFYQFNPSGVLADGFVNCVSTLFSRWNDRVCSSTVGGGVCKQMGTPETMRRCGNDVTFPPPTTTTPMLQECPTDEIVCEDGWAAFQPARACYMFINMTLPYAQYRTMCMAAGGDMVSIHSDAEMEFVRTYAMSFIGNRTYYLGASSIPSDTHSFDSWADGTPFNYGNFTQNRSGRGNPNCLIDVQLNANSLNRLWDDVTCSQPSNGAVCKMMVGEDCVLPVPERTTPTTTTTTTTACVFVQTDMRRICPAGWTLFAGTGMCYLRTNSAQNWSASRDVCRRAGSELASEHSTEEKDFIQRLIGTGSAHLGLMTIPNTDTTYRLWSDGSAINYTNWNNIGPSGRTYDAATNNCVEQYSTGWNDLSCAATRRAVCQRESMLPPPVMMCGPDVADLPNIVMTTNMTTTTVATTPTTTMMQNCTTTCPSNWTVGETGCFMAIIENMNWNQFRNSCQALGADLASFHSTGEMTAARMLVGTRNFWFGLYQDTTDNPAPRQKYNTYADGTYVDYADYQPAFLTYSMTNGCIFDQQAASRRQWNAGPCANALPAGMCRQNGTVTCT